MIEDKAVVAEQQTKMDELKALIDEEQKRCDEQMADLADQFGCTHEEPEIKARCLLQLVRDFQLRVGCPSNLGELGVKQEDIGKILEASKLSTNIGTNPRPLDDTIRSETLSAAIAG